MSANTLKIMILILFICNRGALATVRPYDEALDYNETHDGLQPVYYEQYADYIEGDLGGSPELPPGKSRPYC